jgi:hypothetical protein
MSKFPPMPVLHDGATRASLKQRLATRRPDATRRWGTMSVDQMLHHVNHALNSALGREPASLEIPVPLPAWLGKWIVLYVPWPKGSPTAREWISTSDHYDFETEQRRALDLIDEVAAVPIAGPDWPQHHLFGDVGGDYWSRVNAKHLDHHLRQFSA